MKKKVWKQFAIIMIMMVTLVGVVGCNEAKKETKLDEKKDTSVSLEQQEDESQNQLPKVHIASMNTLDVVPFQMIINKQLDEKNGFQLIVDLCQTKDDEIKTLGGRELEGIVVDMIDVCRYRDEGLDIRALGQNKSTFRLIASKEAGIDSIHNAKSAKTAVMKDSLDEYLLDSILATENYRDDFIKKEELANYQDGVARLQNGTLEMALLKEPYATQAILQGGVELANSLEQYESTHVIAFNYGDVASHKTELEGLLKAYNEAVKLIGSMSEEEKRETFSSIEGFSEEVLDKGMEMNFSELVLPIDEELEGIVTWSMNHGLCKSNYLTNELIIQLEEMNE